MKDRPAIKKVYLINQDYSFGQSVRAQARAMLKEKRPDIEIVGDELHPLLKVTDFSPYIAKIKASGADTVITGNWGQDFALLLKAAADAGTAGELVHLLRRRRRRADGDSPERSCAPGVRDRRGRAERRPARQRRRWRRDFRAKIGTGICYPRAVNDMRMLAKAIDEAKADDAEVDRRAARRHEVRRLSTAAKSSCARTTTSCSRTCTSPASARSIRGASSTRNIPAGAGSWSAVVKAADTVLPTTCKMERPLTSGARSRRAAPRSPCSNGASC